MSFGGITIGRIILNYVGATVRWLYGTIWRTIFKKQKYTYKEYVYGPNNSDWYDFNGHQFNNRIIGALFLVLIISFFVNG